jgi:hypothetical protein
MSKKQTQNPMQYRVRSASRKVNRCFRKRESAEAYFDKVCQELVNDPIILENLITNTILKDYINSQPVGVTIDIPYVYHYKDGKFVKEESKQEVTSSCEYKNGKLIRKDGKLTFYGWLHKIFKKEK